MKSLQSHLHRHLSDDEVKTNLWCLAYAAGIVGTYLVLLKLVF